MDIEQIVMMLNQITTEVSKIEEQTTKLNNTENEDARGGIV